MEQARVRLKYDLTHHDAKLVAGAEGTTCEPQSEWARSTVRFTGVRFDCGVCVDVPKSALTPGDAPKYGGRHEPPFGWSFSTSKELLPNPREQVIVRRAHLLRSGGMSLRDIARALEKGGAKSRAGTPLTHKQVDKMIVREPARGVFRRARPLDAYVAIDLWESIRGFRGESLTKEQEEQLFAFVWDERVSLRVLALTTSGDEDPSAFDGRSDEHRRLGALAAHYIRSIGKEPAPNGNYAGGRADVSASDGSLYVECGTLNPRKVINAMQGGNSLLLLPYGRDFYRSDDLPPGVQLGLLFVPKAVPRSDPFKDNATEGLSEHA